MSVIEKQTTDHKVTHPGTREMGTRVDLCRLRTAFQSFAFDFGARAIPLYSSKETSPPHTDVPTCDTKPRCHARATKPTAKISGKNAPPEHDRRHREVRRRPRWGHRATGPELLGPQPGRGAARPHLRGPGPRPHFASAASPQPLPPPPPARPAAPPRPPPGAAPPSGLSTRPLPAPVRLFALTPSSSSSSEPASSGWSKSMSNTPAIARVWSEASPPLPRCAKYPRPGPPHGPAPPNSATAAITAARPHCASAPVPATGAAQAHKPILRRPGPHWACAARASAGLRA